MLHRNVYILFCLPILLLFLHFRWSYICNFIDTHDKIFYIFVTSCLTVTGSYIISNYNYSLQKKRDIKLYLADILSYLSKVQISIKLTNFHSAMHYYYSRLHQLTKQERYQRFMDLFLTRANNSGELFENQRAEFERLVNLHGVDVKNLNNQFVKEQIIIFKRSQPPAFTTRFKKITNIEELENLHTTISDEVWAYSEKSEFFKCTALLEEYFSKLLADIDR